MAFALATKTETQHRQPMGKVIVKIKLTNLKDSFLAAAGARKAAPRTLEVEALVDTGATRLYLKPSVIKKLGLDRTDTVRSRTTHGDAIRYKYEAVRLELMGRGEVFEVIEVPENVPNLLGQVPLEVLDFVVDPRGQKLIPQPRARRRADDRGILTQAPPTPGATARPAP